MKNAKIVLFFLPLLVIGCQGLTPPATSTAGGVKPDPVSDTAPPKQAEAMPDSLKHEGYRYYGLSSSAPINLQVTGTTLDGVMTGSQTKKFKAMNGPSAVFTIDRTGKLVETIGGQQEVEVRPDGIYATTVQGEKVEPPQLELPAVLTAGKTWKVNSSFNSTGGKIDMKADFKVLKQEKIKTKAGVFDAWRIQSSGQYTTSGQKMNVKIDTWYVDGMGEVKMVMAVDSPGNKGTMTVEATK